MDKQSMAYILNHLGEERSQYHGAVSPPVFQTSNFVFDSVADFRHAVQDEKANHLYTRGSNPTIDTLCAKLAAMEGAEDALVFASGSAAVAAAITSVLQAGDHVICVKNAYSWTYKLLNQLLARFGVETTNLDSNATEAWEAAIRPNTKLFVLESPNSILLELQDVEALCRLAKQHNITTIMDNSYGSLINTSPMELGVDVSVHSATKFVGGHSDVVAGLVCGSKAFIKHLFHHEFMTLGGIISPLSAWLLLRSMRTYPIRVKAASASCTKVVDFLRQHPKVAQIHWPFLNDHPQRELARKQMPVPIPMFSMQLQTTDRARIEAFADALNYFLIGASWGGHESLILPASGLPETTLPLNLFRIYVGLEEVEELIADLEQALRIV